MLERLSAPARPGKTSERFEIWQTEIIADSGDVKNPEIEFQLVISIPIEEPTDEIDDGGTENPCSDCLESGSHRREQQIEQKSRAGEGLGKIDNDGRNQSAESISDEKTKPFFRELRAELLNARRFELRLACTARYSRDQSCPQAKNKENREDYQELVLMS